MKKSFLLVLTIAFVLASVAAASATTITLFEDNFNDGLLDGSKWTQWIAGGASYNTVPGIGDAVYETGGVLKLAQNTTDHGGMVVSAPIILDNPTGLITLTRKTLVHGNSYLRSSHGLSGLFGIGHYKAYKGISGFGQTTNYLAPIYDQWFSEIITYDPVTGNATYSVNDQTISFTGNPLSGTTLELYFNSYGWFTGHYTLLDDVTLTQESAALPTPEPASVLLLSAGLIGLAGYRKKINSTESEQTYIHGDRL